VAYEFKHDYDHACEYFKRDIPRIGGGVSAKEGKRLEAAWNAGELDILFAHPASVGHGLNMQECEEADCIVWFCPTYDLEHYDQFNRRLRRSGAKFKRLFIHRLIAYNTADHVSARALHGKHKDQKSFLDALKTYRASKPTAPAVSGKSLKRK
jgi:hypothetical protein